MDKIIKAESVAHGNPKIDHYRGAVAACFYGSMSIATVFLNKAIFKVHKFHFPATLVAGQMAFTMFAIVVMQQVGVLKKMHFSLAVLRKVGLLSFFFLLKLVLDMSALNTVNIPMYGVLKSSTTPCVLLLDYLMRGKSAASRIQASVWIITLGGLIAGIGDLTFHPVGYLLALSSAMSTAAYVVTVGKLGDEAKLDSFTLLFYNCCWSLPMSMVIMVCTGEWSTLATFPRAAPEASTTSHALEVCSTA
ncbi:hypothetical protein CYMTET_26219 [Cymbomonas tetramitiformis]|uniref:Sugar phosphate transporter domain-containing protein n=1 Tax=Cymbomonas tetramitiformis TaxID=36881 RepID=A0AAE0FSR2_9CHLO|nr:hypothetical protein CYMTET_26219 [Cymbomonas tetramitiformis]